MTVLVCIRCVCLLALQLPCAEVVQAWRRIIAKQVAGSVKVTPPCAPQDGTTVTTACYTMRRMAHLVPNAVLPLVCQRFEVRSLSM